MKRLPPDELLHFLESKVRQFMQPDFIPDDPLSIPHLFTEKEDIEIAGFLAATIAWGQRPVIIRNCRALLERMDYAPADFIRTHEPADRKPFLDFVHRTFNGTDLTYFLKALQQLYCFEGGLEGAFSTGFANEPDAGSAISAFRTTFLSWRPQSRTGKHIANPASNAAGKRLCMYLRWMVRPPENGVDLGIWKSISPAQLATPLDVHSARVARALGLLERKQDDWKAVMELTDNLRQLNPQDPVRYDFALFGLGAIEGFPGH